ncbi:TolC family protein [Sorangium sp. So ce861]|uniref:TolC family protein n=1 Tax=Sorangium sp. So ce861 TaxID=3133323 RepID=UPI003F61116D
MKTRQPHRMRCAMFAALAAALMLLPALEARGETLTWDQVKARAAARSPAAAQAKQAVRAARAEASGAGRWPRSNPVLKGGAELGAPFGHPEDLGFSVELEQELDVFGVAAAGARAGRQGVAVAEGEAAVLRLDGLAEAAEAFIELDRAQRALGIWTDLDRTFGRIATGASKAAEAGERSELDAILAHADSAGATSELSQARAELARAQARLAVVVAAPDAASLRVASSDSVQPPDARAVHVLLAAALRRRPEAALWRARLDEAEARRTLAARSVLPQPTLGLGIQTEREQREAALGDPGGQNGLRHQSTQLQISLSVPLPFFDTGQAERARALADASSAREQAEIAVREIKAAVTRAKSAADASWTALTRWQAVAPRLDEAQSLLEKGYAAGQVDLFDTLAGAERVARARVRILEARADYLKARAALSRALGEEP